MTDLSDLQDISAAATAVVEQAVVFDCEGESLVGVVSAPAQVHNIGVVIVVGGPQYRAGAHRQFVLLARHLAASGHAVLRFDVRGMGDSSGDQRPFDRLTDDVAAAIAALKSSQPAVRNIVLWGLCDGASAALIYAHDQADPAVCGLVLLNPWVRSAETLARTHLKHYYWRRLRQGEFWRKLLRGGVAVPAVKGLVNDLQAARRSVFRATRDANPAALPFQERMLRGIEHVFGSVLWVLSGQDYTAKEFVELVGAQPRWQAALARANSQRLDMPEADHTFSDRVSERLLADATVRWLRSSFDSPESR